MSSISSNLDNTQRFLTAALIVFLSIGIIGHALNCIVFLRKKLSASLCSTFFVATSVTSTLFLIYDIVLLVNSLHDHALENANLVFCKLCLYLRHVLLGTSRTYLIIACISCYIYSSRHTRIRNLFRQKMTLRIIALVPIVWMIIPVYIPIFSSIHHDQCRMQSTVVTLYHSFYVCFIFAILPFPLMIAFSVLIYQNLRKRHRIVRPIVRKSNPKQKGDQNKNLHGFHRCDRQLSTMLLIQIIVYISLTILHPIHLVYNTLSSITEEVKSNDRIAMEKFLTFMTSDFLIDLSNAVPFLVFLISHTFRKELCKVIVAYLC
ncbi:unnamed protein product [Adineta ricciae]|uniref:G-protein coupled receptors family 1 profile domain-containing protein n=1 Tax=Adineta ricciae TaxID=249248 RepID=A0A814CME2_ADIRI|nr:unnamed protein product [Adineta ricciae]CAF1387090.1 unnamed protein product [Adineta ricciae]